MILNWGCNDISVVIPSFKREVVTLYSLSCPVNRIVISRGKGLGYARNRGACEANDVLLVFLDDDLILDKEICEHIVSTEKGQFKMLSVKGKCSSRVIVIWASDFWALKGFDEKIRYSGEDVDFFLRALKFGLRYVPIPETFARHIKHRERWQNKCLNIKIHFERARHLVRHGKAYLDFQGLGFRKYFWGWIKKPRSHLITFVGFFYYLLKGVD